MQSPGLLTTLGRQADVVLLTVFVALLLAVGATVLQRDVAAATGSLVLSPVSFLEPGRSDAVPELAETVIAVADSPEVLRRTAAAYVAAARDPVTRAERQRTATDDWIRDHIGLRPVGTSAVVEVKATAGRPDDAQALADAAVTTLASYVEELRDRTTVAGNPERAGIRTVTTSRGTPQGWVSPTPLRNDLVALVAGLAVGCALALFADRRQRRQAPRKVAARLGVPWLGTVRQADDEPTGDRALGRFLEGVHAAARSAGHVALVTGSAPPEDIALVARAAVRSLNGRADRALLVDGSAGLPGIARRLQRSPQPAAASPSPLPAGSAWVDAEPHVPVQHGWPEYAFVVISGPSTAKAGELLRLMPHADSVLLAVAGDDDVDVLRALARAAAEGGAAVGVIGVAGGGAQASNSS